MQNMAGSGRAHPRQAPVLVGLSRECRAWLPPLPHCRAQPGLTARNPASSPTPQTGARPTDLTGDITSTKTFLLILITSSIHTMASRSAISRLTPRALAPRVAVPRQLSTAAAVSRAAVATTPMARVTASPSRYLLSSIQQQRRMASSEAEGGGESMVSLSREAQRTGVRLGGARPLPPAPHLGIIGPSAFSQGTPLGFWFRCMHALTRSDCP